MCLLKKRRTRRICYGDEEEVEMGWRAKREGAVGGRVAGDVVIASETGRLLHADSQQALVVEIGYLDSGSALLNRAAVLLRVGGFPLSDGTHGDLHPPTNTMWAHVTDRWRVASRHLPEPQLSRHSHSAVPSLPATHVPCVARAVPRRGAVAR